MRSDETSDADRDARAVELLRAHGRDAISFLGLEPSMSHWYDEDARALVAYVDTRGAWVACGAPIAAAADLVAVASRFVAAAKAHGRRASFFGTEAGALVESDSFAPLLIGEQPIFRTDDWDAHLRANRSLREQLRRARAKKIRVRRVDPAEILGDLRAPILDIATEWLASRAIEPMHFIVAVEPFAGATEHRYFVAERSDGRLVAFLSAVPIYATRSWLIEDIFRARSSPNGTTELLIDALIRDVTSASSAITLGLAPLTGNVAPWLRAARFVTSPLYDFRGLRAFKARLHPSHWDPVYLVHPRSHSAPVAIFDALAAFAGGAIFSFALRSLARHPSGPPWALAAPLVPWTLLLTVLAAMHQSSLLGFSTRALFLWSFFDLCLFLLLVACARRPTASYLTIATSLAAADAALSIRHLIIAGLGVSTHASAIAIPIRLIATLAPSAGTLALAWAAFTARRKSSH